MLGTNLNNGNVEGIYVGNGNIYIDDSLSHDFYTVDFEDYNALEKAGDSLYSSNGAIPTKTKINQGFLEKSNVSTIN